jgi:hypothetical protein
MADDDIKQEIKESKMNMTNAVMAIMGSLLAFMFYGRIQDAADIVKLKNEVEQHGSELRDVWGKYNDAGEMMMNFRIEDAREKEQIKEKMIQVQLENEKEWKEYWKRKALEK